MSRCLSALLCALAVLSSPGRAQDPPDWAGALQRLGHASGSARREAAAWLIETLGAPELAPFLEALSRERGEVRLRGLGILAARADLFAALALLALQAAPGPVLDLTQEAIQSQVASARRLPPEAYPQFQPLPALVVRLDARPRAPAEVAGLLARVCEFPLPLIVWPGSTADPWRPPRAWGGDLRRLVGPGGAGLDWLQGERIRLGRDLIVLGPGEGAVATELGACLWALLGALREEPLRAEAALALGLLPYPPLGSFLLTASGPGGPSWPELRLALAAFARGSGLQGESASQAWSLLLEDLAGAEGQRLAWLAVGLAALGPGPAQDRSQALATRMSTEPRERTWKFLLPAQVVPFPGLAGPLLELLAAGPASPREAALALRAASLLGSKLPWEPVARAARLAGPGVAAWAARLVAPLAWSEQVRQALGGPLGESALAMATLAQGPGFGTRELIQLLEQGWPPERLAPLLGALRLAADAGDGEVARELLARWPRAPARARLALAIGIGLLVDAGRAWRSVRTDPAAGGPLFRTWQVLERVEGQLPELLLLLREAAADPGQPLGDLAARALGRLLGLWQAATLMPYLELLQDRNTRDRGLLLLRELAHLSPPVASYLANRATSGLGPFRGLPLAVQRELEAIGLRLRPPPGAGIGVDVEDPWSFAQAFPL